MSGVLFAYAAALIVGLIVAALIGFWSPWLADGVVDIVTIPLRAAWSLVTFSLGVLTFVLLMVLLGRIALWLFGSRPRYPR